MARANPNTLATGWLRQSNAMTDEEHAEYDRKEGEAKAQARFLNAHPEVATAEARKRDTAPMDRDNMPFSLFKG